MHLDKFFLIAHQRDIFHDLHCVPIPPSNFTEGRADVFIKSVPDHFGRDTIYNNLFRNFLRKNSPRRHNRHTGHDCHVTGNLNVVTNYNWTMETGLFHPKVSVHFSLVGKG